MVGVVSNLVNVVAIFFICGGFAKSSDEISEETSHFQDYPSDITMYQSKNKKFVIYRNTIKHECYVEPSDKINDSRIQSRTLYVGNRKLSHSDLLYAELGEDVISFCKHFPIFTTAEQSPYYKSSLSSKKTNRRKRQTVPSTKSNFKGQTQTQYISFDNEGKEDKGGMAEAVAEREKSRATVQGRIGMGQAQSQSGSGDPCEECIGSGRLTPAGQLPSSSTGLATIGGPQYGQGSGNIPYSPQNVPQTVPGQGQIATYTPQIPGTSASTGTQPSVIGSGQQFPGGILSPQPGAQGTGGYTPQAGGTTYPQQGTYIPQVGGATQPQGGYGAGPAGTTPSQVGGTVYPQQGGYTPQISGTTQPQGQYAPQGGTGAYQPGAQQGGYIPQISGATQPQGQYGPQGGSGVYQPGNQQGAYTPQIGGATQPQGQYVSQGGTGTQGGYTPQISGTTQPQGQYAPQGGTGTYPPGAQQGGYTPQISGTTQPQGQYGAQGGTGTQGGYTPQISGAVQPQGQYAPQGGTGTYQPGIQQGGYTPQIGGTTQPQGQYAPQGGTGTYQPGVQQGVFTPQISGATQPQGQYAPQGGTGTYQPGVQQGGYTPQISGTGQSLAGQYIPQVSGGTQPQGGYGVGLAETTPSQAVGTLYPQAGFTPQGPQQGSGTSYPQGGSGVIPPQPGSGVGAFYPQQGGYVLPGGYTPQGIYTPQGTGYPQQNVQTQAGTGGAYPGGSTPQGSTYPSPGQNLGTNIPITGSQSGVGAQVPGSGFYPSQTFDKTGTAGATGVSQVGQIPSYGFSGQPTQGVGTSQGAQTGPISGTYPQGIAGPQINGGIQPQQGPSGGITGGTYSPTGQGPYVLPSGGTTTGGYTPQGFYTPSSQQPGGSAGYPQGNIPPGQTLVPGSGAQSGGTQYVGGYYPTQTPYQTGISGANQAGQTSFYGSGGQPIQGGGGGSLITPLDADSGESQSLSSLNIHGNDTKAQASAQGKTKNGKAQVQISGTYTGSFSAQAQTSDNEKSVEAQIFGNSTGAVSSSQGKAGKSQSQSQMRYDYHTGASIAEAQGGGINYNTNSQIQAGNKGGLADAQSSGPGSTSSQAQIGFLPYDATRKDQTFLFEGGGTSSSQNGAFSGQSQTQLQGAYRFGPSFLGAAQASSGRSLNTTKLAFDPSSLSTPTHNDLKQDATNDQEIINKSEKLINEKKSSSKKENNVVKSTVPLTSLPQHDQEKKSASPKTYSYTSKTPNEYSSQDQNAQVKSKYYDALIYTDSSDSKTTPFLNPGDVVPGTNDYKIPPGFRGKITSTAGDVTQAVASSPGQAQTQTVILKPGEGRVTINDRKQQKHSNVQNDADNAYANIFQDKKRTFDDYVTVTKSETGELNNGDKKYSHTYYTKSSSCGYFTFTCNLIDGSKGRTKICKPGPLTYSDGTPC